MEIESEWTARDRELKANAGPARIFLRQVSVHLQDANLLYQTESGAFSDSYRFEFYGEGMERGKFALTNAPVR